MEPIIPEKEQEKNVLCYHCGDQCPDHSIQLDQKYFCCLGCKTVFEILSENDLCNYYDLENNPGISLKNKNFEGKFDFLTNEKIQNKLLDFASENRNKIRFIVPAIHCSSCIWLLENLDKLKPGVLRSQVNFVKKEVSLDFDPKEIDLKEVVETLASLGYEPEITLESYQKDKEKSINRSLYLKIGIAGFSFGNIMLFSFPEYFGLEVVDPTIKEFFPWINMALAIPVFLYCGGDYFLSAYRGLKKKFVSIDVPIALGITALFLQSSYEIISGTGAGYFDSLAGLLFFLLIGKWFQNKTYQNLSFERDYRSYFPLAATVLGKEDQQIVPVTDLKVGDRIRIRNQELIPADSTLLSDIATIDYSFVTGESLPDRKNKGEYIYAGGRHLGSAIELVIEKEVSQSYLTQLWNNEAFSSDYQSNAQLLINRVSKYFTLIILSIAILAALAWYFIDPRQSVLVFTATLIVACPCALALSVPFTWGSTMRVFGKNGFYLRNSEVIEKMASANQLVFDKTGTITQPNLHQVEFIGDALSDEMKSRVFSLANQSNHPLSRSLASSLEKVEQLEVVDFVELEGKGIQGKVKNIDIALGSGKFIDPGFTNGQINGASRVYLGMDNRMIGYFEIRNKYRPDLGELMTELDNPYEKFVLSGDNESEQRVLSSYFRNENMHFNQLPSDKLAFIKDLQEKENKVVMMGDGLNDAGALKQADVGIAIADDISQFTPASDAILDSGKFRLIPNFMKFSKVSMKIVIASFIISFLYNIVGLSFSVSGNLTPVFAAILMPLSSISVVVFTTLTIGFFSKRLGL